MSQLYICAFISKLELNSYECEAAINISLDGLTAFQSCSGSLFRTDRSFYLRGLSKINGALSEVTYELGLYLDIELHKNEELRINAVFEEESLKENYKTLEEASISMKVRCFPQINKKIFKLGPSNFERTLISKNLLLNYAQITTKFKSTKN